MAEPRLLWLDRPEKRNALRLEDIRRLREEIQAAGTDPRVSALIIAGRGPSFCAGVDINEFTTASRASGETLIGELRALCRAARRAPKPVAVAIQGHCIGGALEFALAADFRVCTEDAVFSMPEVFIGIPSVIDAALLERYVGLGRAHEMLLTGEPMLAAEALQRGLVNRVVAPDRLLDSTADLTALASRHHPDAIRAQKILHEEWLNLPFEAGLDSSEQALARSFETGAPQELARRRLP